MRARATILLFLSGLSGCITDATISKEEARQRADEGDDTDYCAENDWYGDGVCDDFCSGGPKTSDCLDCEEDDSPSGCGQAQLDCIGP